jgi:hypothetical protein
MNTLRKVLLTTAAISALGIAYGADQPSKTTDMSGMSKDHMKGMNAADYRSEAESLRTKAMQHREEAKVFHARGAGKVDGHQVAKHCDELAASYEKAAKDADAMADALSK